MRNGKSKRSSCATPHGDGDGVYPIFIWTSCCFVVVVLLLALKKKDYLSRQIILSISHHPTTMPAVRRIEMM